MSERPNFWKAVEDAQAHEAKERSAASKPLRGLTTPAEFASKTNGILELLTSSPYGFPDLATVCHRVHELSLLRAGILLPEAQASAELEEALKKTGEMAQLDQDIAREDMQLCLDTRRQIGQLLSGVTPVRIRPHQRHFKPALHSLETLRGVLGRTSDLGVHDRLAQSLAKASGDTRTVKMLDRADPFGEENLLRVLRLNWQDQR